MAQRKARHKWVSEPKDTTGHRKQQCSACCQSRREATHEKSTLNFSQGTYSYSSKKVWTYLKICEYTHEPVWRTHKRVPACDPSLSGQHARILTQLRGTPSAST